MKQAAIQRAFLSVSIVAMGLAAGCSRDGSSASDPPEIGKPVLLQLDRTTDGLKDAHRNAAPLLEKVACIPPVSRPGQDTCNTTRLYRDGAFYMLVPGRWNHLSNLSAESVRRVEDLFAQLCQGTDPVLGNDAGSTRYLVTSPRCTREFMVTGIPAGTLSRITEADDILNRQR